MNEGTHKKGSVFLVGAGPGDPDLVTVKAMRLLERCDVVVYDNLVPDEVVATLPAEIERRYVGKKAGKHTLSQAGINALLVELAEAGNMVVRLKGGDPFIFGRGGEEAQFLKEHGIPFEVVPGITAGIAAPALVGIPCTDRRKASSVTFVTGHRATENTRSEVPWEWIGQSKAGTLVVYMGVSEIGSIVDQLMRSGMAPTTPTAAIERGSLPTQRIVCAPLSELADKVRDSGIRPPAVFVIGETVNLHESLHWLEERPLFGARVLETRPADQAHPLYRSLRRLGAEVQPFPTIATTATSDSAGWRAIRSLQAKRRWLVFTSQNGVRYFLGEWQTHMGDIRGLCQYRIAALGGGAVRALKDRLFVADYSPTGAKTAVLARQMTSELDLRDATVVRVRGSLGDPSLEETLCEAGVTVISLEVYHTFPLTWPLEVKEKILAYPPDFVLFTSGPAVAALAANLSEEEQKRAFAEAAVVSIGPSASKAARDHGLPVTLEVKSRTIPGMIEELSAYWQSSRPAPQ
jgi:uroporphyrinogen III methyltransferase/synthase